MNNIKICTPVTGDTLEKFIGNLEKISNISDCIELRVDSIRSLKLSDITSIKSAATKEAIFTCRSAKEGGAFGGTEDARKEIILYAAEMGFEYIDIEFQAMQEWKLDLSGKTKVILSHHNFKETPNYWEMNKLIFEMNQYHPDIIKIATMVNEEYENTKLYRLMVNKPHTENRIVIGMGEKGKPTRILGPLLGNYLTFASTPYSQSAPGQIDIEDLKKIYKNLAISN